MAKKQKKTASERAPTKHQLSKWQRQEKIRRIVIIAAVVFLVGIGIMVGHGLIEDYKSDPLREVVIEVNGVPFTMEYFVEMLDIYTRGTESEVLRYWGDYIAGMVADGIIQLELIRQGAEALGIQVTSREIDVGLEERGWLNDRVYRDIVAANLSQEKLQDYFAPHSALEQAHVQVVLVESQEVATDLIAEARAGGNFTALAKEFSCNPSIEGDLGWLPRELMPNDLIADAAFNLTPDEISQPIYDGAAIKEVGYWLIKVTDKQDDKINALVMLLGSEAEAEWVKAELVAGGNFSALAGNYSQHESKTKGGKLDGLKRGDMVSTAFDQVAFNLTANEVSEPVKDTSVQTTGGYWLVKVIDRGMHELDEATKTKLIAKRLNDWFEEWKENSTIENLLDADKISWAIDKILERR